MQLEESPGIPRVIARITARREACRDDDLERLERDVFSVMHYIRTSKRVPRSVLVADAADGLALARALPAETDKATYAAIEFARSMGMTWATVATHLGLDSPQGARQMYDRLQSVLAGGPRSEKAAREERQNLVREERWWLTFGADLIAACRAVTDADLPEEALDDALDLRKAIREQPPMWRGMLETLGDMRDAGWLSGLLPTKLRWEVANILAEWEDARHIEHISG